jgi:putative MATE family efflux protein
MADTKALDTMLGDPRRAISSMFLPLAVAYLVIQINLFADTAWCSGMGADASSAVSSMAPIYWIVADVGTGLGIGAAAAIARKLGAGDRAKAESMCAQILFFTIAVSVVLTPLLYLILEPTILFIGAGPIEKGCTDYIMPQILCTFIFILNGILAGIIRAEGAAKRSMIVLVTAAVLNMVLDPILIYVCDLGLFGAGLATVISTAVATGVGLWWYATGIMNLKISFKGFRIKWDEMKDMLYVGVPKVSETTIINVMSLIQRIFVIACVGTVGAALYNIPWRYVMLGVVPATAIGAALIPICSAALGQNDYAKAEEGFRYATKLTVKAMLIITVFELLTADLLIMPLTTTDSMMALRPQFVETLRIYALTIPFIGLIEIGSSILQALRKAQESMVLALIRNLIIVAFFAWASTISMTAISWSLFASEVIGGLMMFGWAKHEIEKKKRESASTSAAA